MAQRDKARKLRLPITCSLKYNFLNLTLKSFVILAILLPSSLISLQYEYAVLTKLPVSLASKASHVFPTTPENGHTFPVQSFTILFLSSRCNISAVFSGSLPQPSSIFPWTSLYISFFTVLHLFCLSPYLTVYSLKARTTPPVSINAFLTLEKVINKSLPTWNVLCLVPLIVCWWSPQKHDYNKDKRKKEAPKCIVNPAFHPVLK